MIELESRKTTKILKKSEQSVRDLGKIFFFKQRPSVSIIKVPWEEEEKDKIKNYSRNNGQKPGKFTKRWNPTNLRSWTKSINPKKCTPKQIILKSESKNWEKIWKIAREKWHLTYKE